MMAAASPRFKPSDTPESTVSGPRAEGYCLATWEISSMGHRGKNLLVGCERPLRHVRHAAVLPDSLEAAPPQLGTFFGRLQDFRECAAPRLHHRDAGGHRLQQENALRLVVGAGDAQQVETA